MLLGMCGPDADPFRSRLSRAALDRILNSDAGARYYAEMMTGLG